MCNDLAMQSDRGVTTTNESAPLQRVIMSNGINAIKGFDYQATVILDRLFEHFECDGPTARVRPEGVDDLDLSWTKDAVEHRRYEQIKKPTEDDQGNLKPSPGPCRRWLANCFPIPS